MQKRSLQSLSLLRRQIFDNTMNRIDTILLCPKNDEESLQIIKIAQALEIPTLVSDQPHGAKLDKEQNLVERLKGVSVDASRVVIVEIPGPEVEQQLRNAGYEVTIVDHHRYDDLDRTNDKSSLEQFLETFDINDGQLVDLGFDPTMIRGLAAMDRGFLWELKRIQPDKALCDKAIEYYRDLTLEMGPERRAREEEVARQAWDARREQDGLIIVESEVSDVSFRDALSYLVAKTYDEPRQVVIRQGSRRMYVQDTDSAGALHDRFGGFLFGGERCWGILVEGSRSLPSVDEVVQTVLE